MSLGACVDATACSYAVAAAAKPVRRGSPRCRDATSNRASPSRKNASLRKRELVIPDTRSNIRAASAHRCADAYSVPSVYVAASICSKFGYLLTSSSYRAIAAEQSGAIGAPLAAALVVVVAVAVDGRAAG